MSACTNTPLETYRHRRVLFEGQLGLSLSLLYIIALTLAAIASGHAPPRLRSVRWSRAADEHARVVGAACGRARAAKFQRSARTKGRGLKAHLEGVEVTPCDPSQPLECQAVRATVDCRGRGATAGADRLQPRDSSGEDHLPVATERAEWTREAMARNKQLGRDCRAA